MTKRIRHLFLLMAVIMCFSLFVGCKRDVNTEPPDTDGTSADTTAKPADTTPPPETNPPEPPVTALELGEDGYAGSYSALPLIHFNYPDVKAANIPKGINVVGIVDTLTEFEAFIEKYSSGKTIGDNLVKIRDFFQLEKTLKEKNYEEKYGAKLDYRSIIIAIPVQPQMSRLPNQKLEVNIRCFSDRWEMEPKSVPNIDESEEIYAGYTFYVITNETINNRDLDSHKNYLISAPKNNNTKGLPEITDFIQYQFRADNTKYYGVSLTGFFSVSSKNDLVYNPIYDKDLSNEDFPISPKELINQFDDKLFEEYVFYLFKTKYTDKDSAYKITKVFGDKNGIAVFYDGKELESTPYREDGGDETAIVTMLFLPKKVEDYKIDCWQVLFQQDPAK